WDPIVSTITLRATSVVTWLEEQDLELLISPGTGTFFRPNMNRESVLGLTFAILVLPLLSLHATTQLANLIEDWQTLGGIGSHHLGILF
ncbi:uncharacterized protein M421DRAFT_20590, partial [Didymella exigua CBS 183.55]